MYVVCAHDSERVGIQARKEQFWLAENSWPSSPPVHSQIWHICIWLRRNFDVKCATFRNHVLGHRKPCASLLDSVTQSRMCGSCYRETDCSSFRVIPGWEELPHTRSRFRESPSLIGEETSSDDSPSRGTSRATGYALRISLLWPIFVCREISQVPHRFQMKDSTNKWDPWIF